MSKLFFFRHGQASLGAANYDVLSDKGIRQSQLLGEYLLSEQIPFDKIFVGPLKRQKDTFKAVQECYAAQGIKLPSPIVIKGLKEHNGIETMKKALPDLIKTDPYLIALNKGNVDDHKKIMRNTMLGFQYFLGEWAEGNIKVEGMTTWKQFREEVKEGLSQVLKATAKGENIGVFSSGGTISAITAECLGLTTQKAVAELNFSIRNTSFSTFLYTNQKFNLLSFNELPHLKKDMITFV
ncbi:MAG: histidine phosphatase family protein, partial [Flavobacteriaceae bacterium]